MLDVTRRTRVIEAADAQTLPVAALIADGRPAILRGIARDVPLVAAGLRGADAVVRLPIQMLTSGGCSMSSGSPKGSTAWPRRPGRY